MGESQASPTLRHVHKDIRFAQSDSKRLGGYWFLSKRPTFSRLRAINDSHFQNRHTDYLLCY